MQIITAIVTALLTAILTYKITRQQNIDDFKRDIYASLYEKLHDIALIICRDINFKTYDELRSTNKLENLYEMYEKFRNDYYKAQFYMKKDLKMKFEDTLDDILFFYNTITSGGSNESKLLKKINPYCKHNTDNEICKLLKKELK